MRQIFIIVFILIVFIAIFSACTHNRGIQKKTYKSQRIIIDDDVIASNDEQRVIEPLWWSVSIYDGEQKYEDDLKPFTLTQRYVFAIQWYIAEVNNGGHYQFFDNFTGIVWEDALKGFEAIGAVSNAAIIRESANRIGGNPSKDRKERLEVLEKLEPDFDDLDSAFYQSENDYIELLHTYIKDNASSFYFDGEVKVPN